jgi:hypothetical protein
MQGDPIRGHTIRWTFEDGPMAGKSFEHAFDVRGTVTWQMLGSGSPGKLSPETKYEANQVGEGVYAVSYLNASGYTLTVVLDYRSGRLVAFASNEKELTVQRGSFETAAGKPGERARAAAHAHKSNDIHGSAMSSDGKRE